MWVVAVLGVPGAGKSTQARLVADHLGGVARSAGDWVRERAAAGDPLARETVHTGQPIPPGLYRDFLADALTGPDPLVLDGSPRDEHHVAVLAAALPPDAVLTGVLLDLPHADAATRVGSRPATRPDDAAAVAEVRIAGQVAGLAGLVSAFRARWPLTVVDAAAPPEAVTEAVRRAVGARPPGCPPAGGRSS